ncbi:DJ-1/PfpI family protein, partial [Streptomyces sp. NPDC055815]
MTRTHEVWVFAFDGVRLLDVSAPLEVFSTAGSGYEVRVCSPDGRGVRTSCGLRIGVDRAAGEVRGADTLIVPGAVDVERCVAVAAEVAGLAGRSGRVASVCTGAFALAAGLLAGRPRAARPSSCRGAAHRPCG